MVELVDEVDMPTAFIDEFVGEDTLMELLLFIVRLPPLMPTTVTVPSPVTSMEPPFMVVVDALDAL